MGRQVAVLMGVRTIREKQQMRQKSFPPDRICFAQHQSAADEDSRAMRQFIHGEISMPRLCRVIAKNNYLDYVTEEQMLNELKITGWL